MDIDNIRKLFPITEDKIYLNHASTGPLTTRARDAIDEILDVYQKEADVTKEMLDSVEEETHGLAAELLGVDNSEISLVKNTSQGIIIPMNAINWRDGSNVVLVKGGFPANISPWIFNLPEVEKRYVELDKGEKFLDKCASFVDDKTAAITVDWVDFLTGRRVNLQRLSDFCKEKGILLFVDGIQGLGAIKINLSEINVDFFSAGSSKWLFGPQGIGIMYISKRRLSELNNKNVGWLSLTWENFNNFSTLPPIKKSASRYEEGTRNLIGIYAFREHLKLFLEIGMDEIEKRIFYLRERVIEGLKKKGCEFLSPLNKEMGSGIVTFRTREMDSENLYQEFAQNNIVVSLREGFIRVSPHFYNTEDEIESFLEIVPKRC
jgi:cysteine desulfurase/selenocysteine lyase